MIGINNDIIEQLFDKLDSDGDGRVSFDEFLDGLFRHDNNTICDNDNYDDQQQHQHSVNGVDEVSLAQQLPDQSTTHITGSDDTVNQISSRPQCHHLNDLEVNSHETNNNLLADSKSTFYENVSSSYLSTLDPDKTGYTEADNVLKLWESLGFTNSEQILINLGFNCKLKVNVQELSAVLEEKLCSPNTTTNPEEFQIALATFQNELTQTKINYEHIRDERNRLRINIYEANSRADLLAQEVDDQNAKLEASSHNKLILLEKKYNEQIRCLQEELQKERETLDKQSFHLREDISKELTAAQEQTVRLKDKIAVLKQENKRLESDVQSVNTKYNELQKCFIDSQKRLEETEVLQKKITELESMQGLVREEHNEEIDSLKAQNKEIQDQNDELILQMETLKQQIQQISVHRHRNSRSKVCKRSTNRRKSHSWLSDCMASVSGSGNEELEINTNSNSVAFNLKRRGNDCSSSDDTEDDDCPSIGKTKRMVLSAKTDSDLDNSLDEEYGETMSQNNDINVTKDALHKEIDELKQQLNTQISRTDQMIVDHNKTIVQMQQYYENSLHNKEVNLKEQLDINSNLKVTLKELKERHMNEIQGLKQCLHKQLTQILQHFANSSYSLNEFRDESDSKSYKQIRNSFATTIFKQLIDLVLQNNNDLDLKNLKKSSETQIKQLNDQLIDAFNKTKEGLEVTHRKTYKGFTRSHRERDENRSVVHKDVHSRHGSAVDRKSITNLSDSQSDILIAMNEIRSQNSHLKKEIQISDEQKRKIEKENSRLHYKCKVLSKLLSEISNGQ
ncbi:blastoderm-specific protein 25D-like [Oppia nitens]|uniref:blastoderm-specific protein 25D-like n=1 Tax=Oppia nitens TaxID=1686743 RepID=UPI0023DBCC35|nr:blastoderm-specific protein 25D-like [Oppia nitens]